jgi:hypothetical protein
MYICRLPVNIISKDSWRGVHEYGEVKGKWSNREDARLGRTLPKTPKRLIHRMNKIASQKIMKKAPLAKIKGTAYITHVRADSAPTTTAKTCKFLSDDYF